MVQMLTWKPKFERENTFLPRALCETENGGIPEKRVSHIFRITASTTVSGGCWDKIRYSSQSLRLATSMSLPIFLVELAVSEAMEQSMDSRRDMTIFLLSCRDLVKDLILKRWLVDRTLFIATYMSNHKRKRRSSSSENLLEVRCSCFWDS